MTIDSLESLPWQQPPMIQHSQRLYQSFRQWTGRSLLETLLETEDDSPEAIAQALFEAPFVLVSHGTEADPILNYGNRLALKLWEMTWDQLIQTPSRYTAESINREKRAQLLEQVSRHGYMDNYEGIRISSTGKRFWIRQVTIWDVLDEQNQRCGQAATFGKWEWIPQARS